MAGRDNSTRAGQATGSGQAGPTPHDIELALRARVDKLVPELLRGAVRDGAHWSVGSVDGEPGTQMKVDRSGALQGTWTDFSEADGDDRYSGDMLKLVCVVKFGGWSRGSEARGQAIAWAKSWLGWDDLPPERLKTVRREAAAQTEQRDEAAEAELAEKREKAGWLWHGSVAVRGTPAEAYLAQRGIDFAALGRMPGALRYCPDVWCSIRRSKHPAMIACIMGLDGDLLGVHRTYLDLSAGKGGAVRNVKVLIDAATKRLRIVPAGTAGAKSYKLTLGRYVGGCIPLWKGASQATLRDVPAGTPVYVSEGIEDGLSVALARPEARVVAGVALSNMGRVALPPQAGPLVFIGQNDPLTGKAVIAFERVIGRQQAAGRKVQLIFPEPRFKDFNDQLLGHPTADVCHLAGQGGAIDPPDGYK